MNTHHSAHDNYRVQQSQNSFMDKSRIYQRYFDVHLVIQYFMCPLGRHQRIFLPPYGNYFTELPDVNAKYCMIYVA